MSVDERFYELKAPVALEVIAELTGARLQGDGGLLINSIAASDKAGAGDICFHEGDRESAAVVGDSATACFIREEAAPGLPNNVAALIVALPRYAHSLAAGRLIRERGWPEGATPVSSDSQLAPSVAVSPGVCIAAGVRIGENTSIGPNSSIGPGVEIGADCVIGASVTVRCALIGDHVHLASGSRIGETGFGVMESPDGLDNAPQYGRVIIHDHVSVGANTCIDRGAFGDTILHENVKIDNLCQIAHNVKVGSNTVMAAFAGISGSVEIGTAAQLGGRVGIADHVKIGDNVKLSAAVGLFRDVPDGETWGGVPAKPFGQWMRELAWVSKQVRKRNR